MLRMLVALVTACASTLSAARHLGRIPEPAADPTGWQKPAYADVATGRALLGVLVVAELLAGCAAMLGLPWPSLVGWAVLAGAGGVLVLCDQRTTYLPTALLRPLAITVGACSLVCVALAAPGHRLAMALGILLASTIATGLFWLLWRLGGGMGFGDVRLVFVLALASAPVSFATWYLGLLAGTCLGALWGLATAAWRRRRPSALGSAFAYGPALWLGAWLALLLH